MRGFFDPDLHWDEDTGMRTLIGLKLVFVAAAAFLGACRTPVDASPESSGTRMVDTETIRVQIQERGEGPLVLMLHGFPELSHSWRHQLEAFAEAGYRAVAPDMRGFGGTEAPEAVEAYDTVEIAADVVALMDALGEDQAILVGHDWGAFVAWAAVLLYPERFTKLITMSVPYGGRGSTSYLQSMRAAYGENFFYMLYFQEPGVAEAEFDPDPRAVFERFFTSPGQDREAPSITSPRADAGGMLGRMGRSLALPEWLSEADMQHYVETFGRTGFRGGLNYYRNFDRTWERTPHLSGATIDIPVLFLAGEQDLVIRGASTQQLEAMMTPVAKDLSVVLFPGAGHWIQQERADDVNAEVLGFLERD